MVYMFCSGDRGQIVVDNNCTLDNVWLNSGRRISKKIKAFYFTPRTFPVTSKDRFA